MVLSGEFFESSGNCGHSQSLPVMLEGSSLGSAVCVCICVKMKREFEWADIPEEDSQGQKFLNKICFRRTLIAFRSSTLSLLQSQCKIGGIK